jgi:hypothetical protein
MPNVGAKEKLTEVDALRASEMADGHVGSEILKNTADIRFSF